MASTKESAPGIKHCNRSVENMKTAIVTGGSGGIGRCTARALAGAGCRVFEFSRREKPEAGIEHITCDVTDEEALRAAVTEVIGRAGRVDILVCNAGFGISGAAELTSSADAHAQLELNLFGMDNAVRAVLPHMRAAGGGRIVCMSSIAGVLPIPFQLWYSVSKAAIDAYVLALQNEVRPFGISVCAVLPGDIRSGFTAARRKSSGGGVYDERLERSVARMEHDEETGMSAEAAGGRVARIALMRRSAPMKALGLPYKAAASAAKLLPRRVSNYIIGRMYAK